MTHSWTDTGTYSVKARVKDTKQAISDWSAGHNINIIITTNNSPNTPSTPSGPSTGHINSLYNFTASTIDPDGDSISYQFDWGNGVLSNWSGFVPSGVSVTMSQTWSDSGTYSVKVRAKDIEGATSNWSSVHIINISITTNHPPNIPSAPNGFSNGYINTLYNFTTSTSDPDGDSISYQFDWGDGTQSEWSTLRPSSASIMMSNEWSQAGVYLVKARAKDIEGALSDWSEGHTITISNNNPPDIPSTPNGPSSGQVDTIYNFTTSSTDPDGDSVSYQFDWGEGILSNWSNFIPSGIILTMSKTWSDTGVYLIKARAKDRIGAISNWSSSHSIIIFSNNPPNIPSIPAGPVNGNINTLYNFTASTTDPDEDSVAYQLDWGNGIISSWSSFVPSGVMITMSNTWNDTGTYSIKARATDIRGATSNWSSSHNIIISSNNPPATPSTPAGPSNGYINTLYNFTTSTSDPDNDSVSYQFDWGNGVISIWSSFVPSGITMTMSNTWIDSGTYLVKARAKDTRGAISNWSNGHSINIVTIINHPPNTPSTPSGPSSGAINTVYNFTTSTIDPDNDSISYQIDWGNGIISHWSNFVTNGTPITMMQAWSDSGIYQIKARAKDPAGAISNWSSTHAIVITTLDTSFPRQLVATISGVSSPHGIAVHPNGSYVYVSNSSAQSITVIRTSDNTITATIPIAGAGYLGGMAIHPNGTYLYVTDSDGHRLVVIQLSDNTVVASVPVNTHPYDVTILPNGNYVYVANWHSNNVSVIRTSDNTVVATIPVGTDPIGIMANPNGSYVYVNNGNSSSVSVIQTSNNTVIATVPVGSNPERLTVLPNGNFVYVVNRVSGTVSVINTLDNTVTATVMVGNNNPWGATPLPTGNYVYVTSATADIVSIIRTSDNAVVMTIPIGDYPYDIKSLPNGNFLYVADYFGNTVSVIGR
jgi:YVTN family beta-propeller protein